MVEWSLMRSKTKQAKTTPESLLKKEKQRGIHKSTKAQSRREQGWSKARTHRARGRLVSARLALAAGTVCLLPRAAAL